MGPRPRGRGILSPTVSKCGPTRLQWGRDRAVAELTGNDGASITGTLASMGPRPRGRGILGNLGEGEDSVPASMGPRPRGRGIPPSARQRSLQIGSFNGAATARSRNSMIISPPGAPPGGFNGAATARSRNCDGPGDVRDLLLASMGPRPRGRGIRRNTAGSRPCWTLQWGRDRAVAEFSGSWRASRLGRRASMGPRPRGRGISSVRAWAPSPFQGFNGAATARSRN